MIHLAGRTARLAAYFRMFRAAAGMYTHTHFPTFQAGRGHIIAVLQFVLHSHDVNSMS